MRPALECGQYTQCHATKDDIPSPHSHQMPIASWLGLRPGAHTSTMLGFVLLETVLCLRPRSHKFLCASASLCPQDSFPSITYCLWLLIFLPPIQHRSLSLEGRGVIWKSYLGPAFRKSPYFLHVWPVVCFFVSYHQKNLPDEG